jgi:LysR family hydrogen peroxide-inducible transcriptional activator
MIGLTLKHLRYFDALATHRHFGRAAEACAISQPALSLQIKELEEIFGAPLVERSYRQVRLTSAGEAFHARTADILLQVGELGNLARAVEGPLGGSLRLGVIPTIAPYLLPRMIKALAASDPDLAIQPREAVTHVLIDDLREARLDLAVVALPISEPALQEFSLFDEDFVLVRPASDTGQAVPSPQLLSEMRLLLLAEGHCFRDQALSFCSLGRAAPREVMEGSSLSTLVQMVGAGIGVTLIPEMAVALETRSAEVCVDRFADPRPKRTVGIVWRKSNPLAPQLMRISAVVRQASHWAPA